MLRRQRACERMTQRTNNQPPNNFGRGNSVGLKKAGMTGIDVKVVGNIKALSER